MISNYLVNERLNHSFVDVELDTLGPENTVKLVGFRHVRIWLLFNDNLPRTGNVDNRERLLVSLSLVERTAPSEHLDVLTNVLLPSFGFKWSALRRHVYTAL